MAPTRDNRPYAILLREHAIAGLSALCRWAMSTVFTIAVLNAVSLIAKAVVCLGKGGWNRQGEEQNNSGLHGFDEAGDWKAGQ